MADTYSQKDYEKLLKDLYITSFKTYILEVKEKQDKWEHYDKNSIN